MKKGLFQIDFTRSCVTRTLMGREDWYRNSEWNADIEAAFRSKLSRSRSSRPQYLTIQAYCLLDRHPEVSLSLIDEYFATGDEFGVSNALCARASAHRRLGHIDEAIVAYKAALTWEETHPGRISTARIDLPQLIAEHRRSDEYDYALQILTTRFQPSDHQFPSYRYYWNGANALIADEMGHSVEAREFAERALRAATQTESPFRYHKNVGLVRGTTDEFGRRVKRIARPSKVRSLFRIISRR